MKICRMTAAVLFLFAFSSGALAQQYHGYTHAGSGEEALMRYVYRYSGGQAVGVTIADDQRSAAFYSTSNYGDAFTYITDLTLDPALPAPLAAGGWLRPGLWVFYFHYFDADTYTLGAQGYYSQDNGASWSDLNALIKNRFGEDSVNLHHARVVTGGVAAVYTESALPGQAVVRADSTKIWRLPLDPAAESPRQGSWNLALVNVMAAASPDGTIVGLGLDASNVVQVFRIGWDSDEATYTPASSIHPNMHPRVIHYIWDQGGFTLADINTEITPATVAAWSGDGASWNVFMDSEGATGAEEAGYHLYDALAGDSQRGYVSLLQWSDGEEGLGEVTAYKIKRTSDGGGSWQTIMEGASSDQLYGLSVDQDGSFYAFPMDRTANYQQPGQYVWLD